MVKFGKLLAAAVLTLILVAVALSMAGQLKPLLFRAWGYVYSPGEPFDGQGSVAAPDYSDQVNWAALPAKADPADLVPEGVTNPPGKRPVDVFFIHPTGYLSGTSWTSSMNPNSAAEENTRWMMANQASAYNGCCEVYAPRYREATIFAYFQKSGQRDAVLNFAYRDVAAAFDYFVDHFSEGRPFIIASHSQGTHHARQLLHDKIDQTDLRHRMVAAYLIGSVNIEFSDSYFARLAHIAPCQSATETGCVLHWDTFADGADGLARAEGSLCTNPLTWRVNEELAPATLNHGAVPIRIPYNLDFGAANEPRGVVFDQLDAPLPQHTWAQCRGGSLFVEDQSGGPMNPGSPGGNYHGLDYNLFYMDIRDNAILRVRTWLENHHTMASGDTVPGPGS